MSGIKSEFIWMDGEMVPFDNATTHVLSHTLHYGLGAFEGIRAYEQDDGRAGIWRLEEHMQRFINTLNILRIPCKPSLDELMAATLALEAADAE